MPSNPEQYCRQIQRGETLVKNAANHHQGMAVWKAELGDPRPEGLTLSLINPTSPDAYWGYNQGTRNPCRLSSNPADYIWEPYSDNSARNNFQFIQLVQAGFLDIEDGEVVYR